MTCYHHLRYVTGLNLRFFKFQGTSETLKLEKNFHLWKLFFLKIKDVDGLSDKFKLFIKEALHRCSKKSCSKDSIKMY